MAVRSEAGLVSGIKLEQVDEQIHVCVYVCSSSFPSNQRFFCEIIKIWCCWFIARSKCVFITIYNLFSKYIMTMTDLN